MHLGTKEGANGERDNGGLLHDKEGGGGACVSSLSLLLPPKEFEYLSKCSREQ